MSESSNASPKTWGTPASHWPFPRPVAEPTPEDRACFAALTAEQRVQWLLQILHLLEIQFGHLVQPPAAAPVPSTPATPGRVASVDPSRRTR
jgi:hypothetical protein